MKKERAHSNQIDTKAKKGIYNNYNTYKPINKIIYQQNIFLNAK